MPGNIQDLELAKFDANGRVQTAVVGTDGNPLGKAKANGWQGVSIVRSSDGAEMFNAGADIDNTSAILMAAVNARNSLYNGTTWDRQRGNTEGTLLASAARTATTTSPIQTNHNARGVAVFVDVTVAGTGTLTPRIQSSDPITAKLATLLVGAAISGVGSVLLTVYPGIVAAAGVAASAPLQRSWVFSMTATDGSVWTYNVSYSYIL